MTQAYSDTDLRFKLIVLDTANVTNDSGNLSQVQNHAINQTHKRFKR